MPCKREKFIPIRPASFNWSKAYLLQPLDNIISHPDALKKRPFRPSYEAQGCPNVQCLLQYDYYRIWKCEHSQYQTRKALLRNPPKKKFSPYRKIKVSAKCVKPAPVSQMVSVLAARKKYKCIGARVDHCGTDLNAQRRLAILPPKRCCYQSARCC
ncbi:uncharacterized protein LOC129749834 [Uranotaenia lowii]|uniref:uncharacterized protein LOC129749834 n=1 Tax=Uranotaenia lowii TaxID=190385 RepID=UPI0024788829|nr:uncharacterized protein LOC129749834 [Uranotaenia lowii]